MPRSPPASTSTLHTRAKPRGDLPRRAQRVDRVGDEILHILEECDDEVIVRLLRQQVLRGRQNRPQAGAVPMRHPVVGDLPADPHLGEVADRSAVYPGGLEQPQRWAGQPATPAKPHRPFLSLYRTHAIPPKHAIDPVGEALISWSTSGMRLSLRRPE